MNTNKGFNPEFSKTMEKITGNLKEENISLNKPWLDLPRVENIIPQHDFLKDIELQRNPTFDLIEKQEEANELLNKIVENTSVLKKLVEINRKTQLNTEELTYVIRAIHEVAKANNKEEANNLFSKALKVINDSGEAAGNIASLTSLLMGMYTTVNTLI